MWSSGWNQLLTSFETDGHFESFRLPGHHERVVPVRHPHNPTKQVQWEVAHFF